MIRLKATHGQAGHHLDKINSGQGTIGQLLVNPSLYESLDGTMREMHRPDEGFPRQSRRSSCRIKLEPLLEVKR